MLYWGGDGRCRLVLLEHPVQVGAAMRAKRSYWFAFGTALGFATIAAALCWVHRQRRWLNQPLVLRVGKGEPATAPTLP